MPLNLLTLTLALGEEEGWEQTRHIGLVRLPSTLVILCECRMAGELLGKGLGVRDQCRGGDPPLSACLAALTTHSSLPTLSLS